MKRKNTVFLFIVFVVAVIVAGGALWYSQETKKDIVDISKKPIKTEKKDMYKDDVTGIQITVPIGWTAVAQEKKGNFEKWESGVCLFDPERKFEAEGGQEKCAIYLWFGKKENMDFKDFSGLKSDIEKTGLAANIHVSKSGKDFLQYESGWEGLMTFIEKDNLVILEQTRFSHDEEIRKAYDGLLDSLVSSKGDQKNEKDEIASVQDLIDGEYVFKPVDTSNWQTYRNEEYGFEFKYPENVNFEKVTGRYAIFVDKNSGLQVGSFVVHYSDPNDFHKIDQEFLMNVGQLDMVYGYESELAKEGSIGIETQRFKNNKGFDFFIVKRQDYHASENEKYKEVYNFSEGKVEDRAFFICGKELCSFRMYFKKGESQVGISRETFLTILSTMGKL